jgi:transposase
MAVEWGRGHVNLDGVTAIGVDELAWQRGHTYMTVVYQINEGCRRLLWIGEARKVKTLLRFFRWFGKEKTAKLVFIASDMWKPYLRVIAKKAGQAVHILDRFHIMAHLSKAIDKVRADEARAMKQRYRMCSDTSCGATASIPARSPAVSSAVPSGSARESSVKALVKIVRGDPNPGGPPPKLEDLSEFFDGRFASRE